MFACSFCKKKAKKFCGNCFEIYCSRKCQIKDWRSHKYNCDETRRGANLRTIQESINKREEQVKFDEDEIKPKERNEILNIQRTQNEADEERVVFVETGKVKNFTPISTRIPNYAVNETKQNANNDTAKTPKVKHENFAYEIDKEESAKISTPPKPNERPRQTLSIMPLRLGSHSFYVADASLLKNYQIAIIDRKNLSNLHKNSVNLKSYCQKFHSNRLNYYEPQPAEICLAIYEEDGEWYRALCIEGPRQNKFMMLFVDYGNIAFIYPKCMMPILDDSLLFPCCTHLCRVRNLKRANVKALQCSIKINPLIHGVVEYCKFDNVYEITI